ncbi:restriction endonuclease subunit S [Latilactobacillus curvatus]
MSNKVPQIRFNGYSDDWEERKLGDVGNTFTGLTGKTKEDFGHGSAKFVTYVNVFQNPIATLDQLDAIEIDEKQNQVQKGDIFFTTSSETPEEVGMSSVWTHDTENVYLNSFTFGYRPRVSFDLNYMASMLRSPSIRKKITFLAQGISRYNISKTKMLEIEIPTPTLSEQKKIGSFFKQLDNTITLHQRKLAKLKEQKKGYLQKMFPKNGAKVPELRFAGFADDWEERKLGEVGKTKSGIGFPDAQQGGKQGTPFYKVSDMNNPGNEVVMMNANNYASDSQLKENKWNPINPQNSGVVFAKVGAAIFLDRKRIVDTSFLIDNNMMSYLFDSSWNRYFGKTLFEKLRLSRFAQVGALPSFNGSDVEDIKVMIPEESEQKMIGDMFEKLDDIIALHQRKLDLLKEQKKGFLQKMFV